MLLKDGKIIFRSDIKRFLSFKTLQHPFRKKTCVEKRRVYDERQPTPQKQGLLENDSENAPIIFFLLKI